MSTSEADSTNRISLNSFSSETVNAALNAVASGDNEQEKIARALVAATLQKQTDLDNFPPRGVAKSGGPRDYDLCTTDAPFLTSVSSHSTLTTESGKINPKEENSAAPQMEKTAHTRVRRTRLEGFVRCSESHLWTLMMNFYERKGVDSWSKGIVPHFITSNSFIGKAYAKVLRGFFSDITRESSTAPENMRLNKNEKLYIIELGAGSGKFSFFLLKALQEMKAVLDFPFENIVYVMTDFTGSYYKFWREHPALRPYIETGQLDFAIFDAVDGDTIQLVNSNVLISKVNPTKNPICAVANYLFDTLRNDIFQIEGGHLNEGLMAVGSSRASEPDPNDPEIISHLSNEYIYQPTTGDYYSKESVTEDCVHLERILEWYKDSFSDLDAALPGASILMPLGAIRAIRRLSDCAGGRAIIISGDKGNSNPELFRGLKDPHIALHGSFSMMVNYHAIGCYVTSRGGFSLYNTQDDSSLQVSCFVLLGENDVSDDSNVNLFLGNGFSSMDRERKCQFPVLCQAYHESINSFSPNDFFVMQGCLQEEGKPSLKSVVSLLKLSDWVSINALYSEIYLMT
uniref:Uncharacterized protein n=1 Tax=Ditylum brightwellii TaxID=49249 RepID=A0A7S4UV03_9STRA